MAVENSPFTYPPTSDAERDSLREFVRTTPFIYGNWQRFKGLYKQVEADGNADFDLLAEFIARLDNAPLRPTTTDPVLELEGIQNILHFLVREGIAYVLHQGRSYGKTNLSIFRLSPANPLKTQKLSELSLTGWINRIAFCGTYLVAISDKSYRSDGNLIVCDVTDPVKPVLRGSVTVDFQNDVACKYPFIYGMSMGQTGNRNDEPTIRVVSIADPDRPQVIAELPKIPSIAGVDIANDGRTLIVAAGGQGFAWNRLPKPPTLHLVDVSDPFRSQVVGQIGIPNLTAGVASGQFGYLLVQRWGSGMPTLKVVDLSNPKNPTEVAALPMPNSQQVTRMLIRNGLAFLTLGYGGTHVVDVSNPTKPQYLSVMPSGNYQSVECDGDVLYPRTYAGIEVWNLTNPRTPARVGVPPSANTIGYMKRRARRLLRTIGKKAPERYGELASRVLMASGKTVLNPTNHWIAFDILFGGGTRWEQLSHGRGGYKAKGGPKLLRRTREERYPEVWNARPDIAMALLDKPASSEAHEFAVRVLMSQKTPLPKVSDSLLSEWVQSNSALLVPLALRRIVERFSAGKVFSARTIALAFFRATPEIRVVLADAIGRRLEKKWQGDFSHELSALVKSSLIPGARPTQRVIASIQFIAANYIEEVPTNQLLPMAVVLMRWTRVNNAGLAQALARRGKINTLLSLNALSVLPLGQCEPILAGLEEAFHSQVLDVKTLYSLLQLDSNEAIHGFGWRILAASKTPEVTIRAVWLELLSRPTETPALRSAMQSAYALTLLAHCGITSDEISNHLTARPFLAALLSAETFGRMVDTVPASALFALTAGMDETVWIRLRGEWLSRLQRGEGTLSFWTGIEAALKSDHSGKIASRLMADSDFTGTISFLGSDCFETLLTIQEPLLDETLCTYIHIHLNALHRDSALLLTMATHALPVVRGLGLAHARSVGMSIPFALRLLESELPASVALGRTFFETLPSSGDAGLQVALVLCDSPFPSVRRYGREYVALHRDKLPQNSLLTALFENPDPETQYFVAEIVRETPAPAEIGQFERDVLRRRNASRKAKEAIKSRQDRQSTVDTTTLLEMARGTGTPRDAEWALSQLAKRALAGEQIPGFALEGVAG